MRGPILIIEDDKDCREMLATWVELLGVRALTASNGEEGLHIARREKPCLILLDFMMPVMGGREFRLIQAADPVIADVPVVLTSAHHGARDIAAELQLHAVVEKPVAADQIEALIATFCGTDTP